METLKKYNSLFETAPTLVKEWHPTANGNFTPRNLDVAYPEKVWWICSEGHEWLATIEHRMNQTTCPLCEKEGGEKMTDETLTISLLDKKRRKNRRFKTNAVVVIELPNSGHWVYSEMKNFSLHGLCIETDSVIRPGTSVSVKFDKDLVLQGLDKSHKSSNTNGYKTYHSTVKWYGRLGDDQSISSINIGLELN